MYNQKEFNGVFMKKIIVTEKYNNKKLTSILLSYFPDLNQNTLYK